MSDQRHKTEFTGIEGIWRAFKGELDGEAAPDLVVLRTELVLEAGRYTVRFDRDVFDAGTYVLAATVSHQMITLTGDYGYNAGRVLPAIYQLAGDRLRICYGLDGSLPSDFSTAPASMRYLVTYKRAP